MTELESKIAEILQSPNVDEKAIKTVIRTFLAMRQDITEFCSPEYAMSDEDLLRFVQELALLKSKGELNTSSSTSLINSIYEALMVFLCELDSQKGVEICTALEEAKILEQSISTNGSNRYNERGTTHLI